ncbi:hypothetical protein LSCM1_07956 [Leishmania martiniquensis]|uniref:Uncharacterized protein n=1 Tax=Leishmania martiniquensis TaxID=1580590 RepID=A0A836GRB1_9TRYP|nr:hypothetical protein LSCM1_07956 [Leishmania martiniquensis]
MWLPTKRRLSTMSNNRHYSSTSFSSSDALGESSDGGTRSYTGSYSHDSEGFSSYDYTSTVFTSPSAVTITAAAASSFSSAVDSSPTNAHLDVLTPLSAYSRSSTPLSRAWTHSAVYVPDASGDSTAKGASASAAGSHHGEKVTAAVAQRKMSPAETASPSSIPVCDTGTPRRAPWLPTGASSLLSGATAAATAAGRPPMLPAALAPFSDRAAAATTLSSNRSSKERMLRYPWAPIGSGTTTHTTGEGGSRVGLGLSALDTIRTVPIVPPPPEESQRRCEDGKLPYPSHITYRMVSILSPARRSDGAAGEDRRGDGEGAFGERTGPATATATAARKRKTSFTFCGFFRRCCGQAPRTSEDHAAMRQRPHYCLRNHHVPLVNFRTTRAPGISTEGIRKALRTTEEAAGHHGFRDDMMDMGAPSRRQETAERPPSGLRRDPSYAFAPQAGGSGGSIFMRDGDPQSYWIAHMRELASVRLEPIEVE